MNSLNRFADPVYCIMRLIVGLLFACHGAQKVLGWFAKPGQAPQPLDMTMTIGGWIEVICGLLIAIGLLTRPAAFLASGMMAVAYLWLTPAVIFSRSSIAGNRPSSTAGFSFSCFSMVQAGSASMR
jgi:uncharacterized membrane protein YphA (DoxX/SURF4 family)